MRLIPILLLAALPATAFAMGSDSNEPPKTTKTTTECKDGTVWDEAKKACVPPKDSRLDDDQRYRAVRELAYAGKYRSATEVLDAMSDQSESRVLTYRGFIARKTGHFDEGLSFYQQAIAKDPDNILVRSYLGQGYVERGEPALAKAQLVEILARGGAGSWPAEALRQAIKTGVTYDF